MSIDTEDHTDRGRRVEVYPGKEAVVEFDPTLTFECVEGCTWCCHRGVFLQEPDLRELVTREDASATATKSDGNRFVKRESKERDDHVDVDGQACFFLDAEGHCTLQAEHDWKPTRCSVFPLHASLEAGEIHVDVRDDAKRNCDGLNVSQRRVVDHLDAFLPEVLWDLDDPDTDRVP